MRLQALAVEVWGCSGSCCGWYWVWLASWWPWLGGRECASGEGAPGLAEMLWERTDALASLVPPSGAQALTVLSVVSPFLAGLEAFGFPG